MAPGGAREAGSALMARAVRWHGAGTRTDKATRDRTQLGTLTCGELPGEKPWLETGEVGDWLAGEPALVRYCGRPGACNDRHVRISDPCFRGSPHPTSPRQAPGLEPRAAADHDVRTAGLDPVGCRAGQWHPTPHSCVKQTHLHTAGKAWTGRRGDPLLSPAVLSCRSWRVLAIQDLVCHQAGGTTSGVEGLTGRI